jgi:hypothetical protein
MTLADQVLAVVGARLFGIRPENIAEALDAPDTDVRIVVRALLAEGHLYTRRDGRIAVAE